MQRMLRSELFRSRSSFRWQWFALPLVLGLLVMPAQGVARADESEDEEGAEEAEPSLADRMKTLEVQTKEHLKAKNYSAIADVLAEAKALHAEAAEATNEPIGNRVVDLVGSLTKGAHADETAVAALDLLGELADPRGAKFVKSQLKQRRPAEVTPILERAVAAAGKLADGSLADPLLKIVEDSEHFGIAAAAIQALGAFGECKRERVQILERLVKSVKKNKPGGRKSGLAGGGGGVDDGGGGEGGTEGGQAGAASSRWGALSAVLPWALNALTGRTHNSADEWFQTVSDTKNLASLWRDK